MALTEDQVFERVDFLRGMQDGERMQLDVLRRYVTGKQPFPLVVPRDAPREVKELARISRINLIAIVVNALVQSLYVDSLRWPKPAPGAESDVEADEEKASRLWQVWQDNRMDRNQAGLYRACFTYGYAYAMVLPGRPQPVIRTYSPRKLTAAYGDFEDWPEFALERRQLLRGTVQYRLIDAGGVYLVGYDSTNRRYEMLREAELPFDYCPVIKYTDADDIDLDDEPVDLSLRPSAGAETNIVAGQVAPLMSMQDQTDVSSFALKSAEWYAAFRQRWIKGWTPEDRAQKLVMGASQIWSFEDSPDEIELGEFGQTELSGMLNSRQEVLKYAATLSQTPVHELIGELVNLSAEALAAAEAGRDRKVRLAKTNLGESHEQLMEPIGQLIGVDVPTNLEVVWSDTSARAFGAIVDGLGKIAQMLQVPPSMLWDRIPGVTRQDVERWQSAAAEGDALAGLTDMLDRQAAPAAGTPGETQTESGLILPPGVRS